MLARAKQRAEEMGALNYSITKGDGNVAGFLAEEMIIKRWPKTKLADTYDFDLVLGKYKIEVKCKRQASNQPPPQHYECSVSNYNTSQETDIYVFCRVNNEYTVGWIIGWIFKPDFYESAVFHRKGELDPANGFVFKGDCYNLSYSSLKEFKKSA